MLTKKERARRYYLKHGDKIREKVRLDYIRNKTARDSSNKSWKIQNMAKTREYQRRHHLRKTYNMTLEEYSDILNLQNGVCAICFREESIKGNSLVVDHCHKTGKVRGLLCRKCNSGIGQFCEDIELVKRAVIYLDKIV